MARWSTVRPYGVGWLAGVVRRVQTGFLYTYAFWMVIGLALLLGWFLIGRAPGLTMLNNSLLSLLVWLPILGGVLAPGAGRASASVRRAGLALLVSLATLLLSHPAVPGLRRQHRRPTSSSAGLPWIPAFNADYHLGVDGIALPLILLTTFITVPVMIAPGTR